MWIRVKDPQTGHEFDVQEDSILLRQGLVTPVKGTRYPPRKTPRAPKHHLNLAPPRARRPAPAPVQDVAASAGDEPTPTEE